MRGLWCTGWLLLLLSISAAKGHAAPPQPHVRRIAVVIGANDAPPGRRPRITALGARLKLGILDTCRGGSWTQAKGLSLGPPLEAIDLVPLTSEGTALLSSSSGFENAHEADAVKGSFFTHHLVGGL